jgi:cell division protease FtsH
VTRPGWLRNRWVWGGVGLLVAVAVTAAVLLRDKPAKVLRLDDFLGRVDRGTVRNAKVLDATRRVTGTLSDGTSYEVTFPRDYGHDLTQRLVDHHVELKADNETDPLWKQVLTDVLPTLLIVGAFLWFIMQMQNGGRANVFGRAKPRRGNDSTVTFADVAGADEAVEELTEIRDFLKDPERFRRLGARIPRGVLLHGAPGTGKTLLARAVAGEADAPFFTMSGSDFVEMFVGVGAARVRDLFRQAKEEAPAIVFVDEIDAVGRHRGAGTGGGHDEREQTLNQLLVELDGFDERDNVILMAATNRPDVLDKALLRPGRFDRQVAVELPDRVGREQILQVHARGKPFQAAVDWSVVARRTPGFSGADLANIVNESALLAGRRSDTEVTLADVNEAIDRVMAGPERRSRVMSDEEKRITAYHEAGHAVVGHVLPHCDPIHKVSIVARGRALGWTLSLPEDDRLNRSQPELTERLAMYLGGRAAESLVFDTVTTGAADDIQRATELAAAMVSDFGMSPEIGPRYVPHPDHPELRTGFGLAPASQDVVRRVDAEVQRLLDEALAVATALLTERRPALDRIAERLIEVEVIDEEELVRLIDDPAPDANTAR